MAHSEVESLDRRRKLARVTSKELALEANSDEATLSRWRTSSQAPNTGTLDRMKAALKRIIAQRRADLDEAAEGL